MVIFVPQKKRLYHQIEVSSRAEWSGRWNRDLCPSSPKGKADYKMREKSGAKVAGNKKKKGK